MNNLKSIGSELKAIRLKRGMTQVRLSELTGYDRGTITKIESGNHNITVKTLLKFAKELNFRIEFKKEGSDDPLL